MYTTLQSFALDRKSIRTNETYRKAQERAFPSYKVTPFDFCSGTPDDCMENSHRQIDSASIRAERSNPKCDTIDLE